MSAKQEYTQIIKDVYSINSFVKLCGMELVDVECGKVTLAMPIDAAKHTNARAQNNYYKSRNL